ncbi:MAG: serine dehydrogenasease [Bacteroidota bacterium]|nr:serine dehydrogenasease [Bacteroidota bacterium]
MVSVLRKHYKYVYFVVPDFAMSAGTVLCMSADKMYMDYSSSLGPIDPQVPAPDTGEYVPALVYLDKVSELTNKGNLAPADLVLLRGLDLGKLALYEQARDLSVDLLKKWPVKYKFKNWTHHRTNKIKKGKSVTRKEKECRAEEIAKALGNHKMWRSHGRSLDIKKLKNLRVEIEGYSDHVKPRNLIREYNDPLTSYNDRTQTSFFLHHHQV